MIYGEQDSTELNQFPPKMPSFNEEGHSQDIDLQIFQSFDLQEPPYVIKDVILQHMLGFCLFQPYSH